VIASSAASTLTPLHGVVSVGSDGNLTALRGAGRDPSSNRGISGK
jgi:hypothetical protein